MLTPKQAESLAQQTVQDYVNKCGCRTAEDVGNVLMKLVSMCGLGMCAVGGKVDAVSRLRGTAEYIEMTQEGVHWKSEVIVRGKKH